MTQRKNCNMSTVDVNTRLAACTTEEDKAIFSLKDPGTPSRATVNVKPRKCQKIKVDGGLNEIQPVRCDWCIRDKDNGECLFVELKGNDCLHAAEQIANTIRWFRDTKIHSFILHKPAYIVTQSGIPKNNSQIQIAMARLAQKVGATLKCVHSPATLKF